MAEVEVPVEIITEILTRLPVKPLYGFKCVSKHWNSLISSPSFITRHLNIVISDHSVVSALIPENHNELRFFELNHPLKLLPARPKVGLVETCNGILLISDYAKTTLFLYNPANNTYRLLPPIPTPSRNDEYIGFGYDSNTDDYKIIRVVQTPREYMDMWVYTMRENVWGFFRDGSVLMRKHFIQPGHAVGVNGVLYFMAATINRKLVLMCFDVRTDEFSIGDYPELDCDDFSKLSMSMKELCGSLCLVVNYRSKGLRAGGQLLYSDVWEMKEGAWVKLFRIRKGKQCNKYFRLVAYSKDKGKLLIEFDGTWFGWYDLVTKKVKIVKTHGLRAEDAPYVAMTYVESLVSVSNGKGEAVFVSEGGSTSKKTVENIDVGGFLSKGFKLRL